MSNTLILVKSNHCIFVNRRRRRDDDGNLIEGCAIENKQMDMDTIRATLSVQQPAKFASQHGLKQARWRTRARAKLA